MRNRKSRVFVVVCIILLVASVAEVSILTISSYHRLAEKYANDFKAMLEIRYGATVTFLIMIIPMVLPEFSFIRSGSIPLLMRYATSGSRKNLPNSFGNSGIPDGFDGAALVPWNRELRLG